MSVVDFRHRASGHRTQAEIVAQLEARYAEMKAQAATPTRQFPCAECRWVERYWRHTESLADCQHPLVMGLERKVVRARNAALCGPEKALWEPYPTLWQRIWQWFIAPWQEKQHDGS